MEHKTIMLVAGEASGDRYGAEIATAILKQYSKLTLFGIGGKAMRAAAVQTFMDINELAVMGFVEVIRHLPRIVKIFRQTKKILTAKNPDMLILIDYPGFNLRLAKVAKKLKIPVLFYISPQIWAWRPGRIKKIVNVIDHMAVIFPFEKALYAQHNVNVTYVGHPLVERIRQAVDSPTARAQLKLDVNDKVITVLPGSRKSETRRLLPILLQTIEKLKQKFSALKFLLVVAPTIDITYIKSLLKNYKADVRLITTDSITAISAADIVLTASGTATLETALLHKPMIVVYKVHPLTAALARCLLRIPYVSLCNIVAGKKIVPELLQQEANVPNLLRESYRLLEDKNHYLSMKNQLLTINSKLSTTNTANNVAHIALQMLKK